MKHHITKHYTTYTPEEFSKVLAEIRSQRAVYEQRYKEMYARYAKYLERPPLLQRLRGRCSKVVRYVHTVVRGARKYMR